MNIIPFLLGASAYLFILGNVSGSLCSYANWWRSFDYSGRSACPARHYIVGLERSRSSDYKKDYIYHIEGAQCCKGTPAVYENQNPSCLRADWVHSFDRTNTWNMCPNGYFLSGLERSGNIHGNNYLHNIEYGYCCKPNNSPIGYKHCFKANVWDHFNHDDQGMVSCGRHGYYITGIYRSSCDLVYCIEEFMCCSMK